jgi:2-polyprenyl-6-methoxyphenol hydroxylase-like FAD-dependent oxidoreductase
MTAGQAATETEVLIAGGGPVGMALACELGRRGIDCLLVDDKPGFHDRPRAAVVGPRTVEFFRRWGIADQVLAAGLPFDFPIDVVFTNRLAQRELGRLSYPSQGAVQARSAATLAAYPPLAWSPYTKTIIGQQALEPVIHACLARYPSVAERRGTKLLGFAADEEGVTATIQGADGEATVRARYLAACDGGRSEVRRLLGTRMSGSGDVGQSVNIFFRAPGLIPALGKAPGFLLWSFAPGATGSFLAIDGRELWVFQRYLVAGESFQDFDPVAALHGAIGLDVGAVVIDHWHWVPKQLVADSFQSGRVFLAGDAAHLMPPSGGFGLNTGVGDAVNLAWKLAAVLRGWGGPGLLESYTAERRPVAIRNSEESAENRVIMHRTMHAAAHIEDPGEEGAQSLARFAELLPLHDKHFDGVGVYLGDDYGTSAIVVPDGTPEPPRSALRYHALARPGARLPHRWLADGLSILDRLGLDFTLLTAEPEDAAPLAAAMAAIGAETLLLPLDAAGMRDYEARHLLVRPDGHVAWRGDGCADPAAIASVVTGHQAP